MPTLCRSDIRDETRGHFSGQIGQCTAGVAPLLLRWARGWQSRLPLASRLRPLAALCAMLLPVHSVPVHADVTSRIQLEQVLSRYIGGGTPRSGARFTLDASLGITSTDNIWSLGTEFRVEGLSDFDTVSARGELRQFTLTRKGDTVDLAIGLDQLNWGRGDRVRVLDRLHAMDASEPVFRDLQDYRRPDWMARVLYLYENGSVEAVLIPRANVDRIDFSNRYAPQFAPELQEAGRIQRRPSGSSAAKFGLRWDFSAAMTDWRFVVISGPSAEGAVRTELVGAAQRLVFEYPRETLVGAGFERPVGELVVRGELAFINDRPISVRNGMMLEIQRDNALLGLAGVDWNIEEWFVGAQLVHTRLLSPPAGLFGPSELSVASLTARRDFAQGLFSFSTTLSSDLSERDMWLSGDLSYHPANNPFVISLGAHAFAGNRSGLFGRHKDNSRIDLSIKGRW